MPTLIFCALFHHYTMTEVGQMNLVLVRSVDIYFVNVRKYINKLFNCN